MVKMHVGFPRATVPSQRRRSKKTVLHLIIILACTNKCRYISIYSRKFRYISVYPEHEYTDSIEFRNHTVKNTNANVLFLFHL